MLGSSTFSRARGHLTAIFRLEGELRALLQPCHDADTIPETVTSRSISQGCARYVKTQTHRASSIMEARCVWVLTYLAHPCDILREVTVSGLVSASLPGRSNARSSPSSRNIAVRCPRAREKVEHPRHAAFQHADAIRRAL